MGMCPRHIDRFKRKYNKSFARYPLFGEDLMDPVHKRVQVFLHSCNTTAIEDVLSGALAEFGGLHKKVEIGDWLTLTPVWVDRPAQKKEGLRKSDRHGIGAWSIGGVGGRDVVFNHRIDPQLRIMKRLGDITAAARLENLRISLAADGREIFLRFLSKGYFVRSCMRSHAHVQGHNKEAVIRYIRIDRDVMDPSRNSKFNGGGYWGSRGVH